MNTLQVVGRLTFQTAAVRLGEVVWPAAGDTLGLDLSRIEAIDSAGVSVLLHWLREAKHRQVDVRWYSMPVALQKLARVYGLSDHLSESR